MKALIVIICVAAIFFIWHRKQQSRWDAQDRRTFVRHNVTILDIAMKDVARMAEAYCPDDAEVALKVRLARDTNAAVRKEFADGKDDAAVEQLEPLVKMALSLVSDARVAVRSRMTPDQIEQEERGEELRLPK
jgi:hypothetical protein